MDLRQEIERLIRWYLPAIIVASLVGYVLSTYIKLTNGSSSIVIWFYTGVNILISHLHHIVIAIWLYGISKKMNQKYVLWSFFGLVAHLFAVVMFLALYIYEQSHEMKKAE